MAREALREHPPELGDVEPEKTREKGTFFDAWMASIAAVAEISAKPSSSSSCSFDTR
jgi:hypothetical protein